MTYTIKLADGVDKVLAKWKKSNPNLFKKYRKIYDELLDHPKTGLGHPEQLRGGGGITWSRHIVNPSTADTSPTDSLGIIRHDVRQKIGRAHV